MSSPSPPKPKKVNPYQGINADADVYRAQQALGIDNIKKDKHMAKINAYLLDERWEKESQRGSFENSLNVAERKGIIDKDDRTDWALNQVLGVEESRNYEEESRENAKQLQEAYEQQRADQLADAEAQQKLMEEMMNQPVYMPKQQQMPVVQAPRRQQEPMLPAPAPNTPMSISAPPAPELTNTGNRMAIIRSPKSIQARSRRATRGTSSLRN